MSRLFQAHVAIRHLNTSALPVRYVIIFLKCCKLIHDAKAFKFIAKKISPILSEIKH